MEEWKEYNIGNLCSKVCSGGTPSSRHSEYYDGNIPWLNTKEINFNRIYSTEKCITEEGLNNSSAKWIEENSVIVAMYGATAGKAAIAKIPLTTNQACCNLTINSSLADYNFVYYHLRNKFTELASLANGGAQQNLNAQIIKEFPIPLPSLNEQRRIASILSSLDDKIEVNRKINENLEQQAQALFKSWFVDFEPFKNGEFVESELGRIPKGWRVGTFLDNINVMPGGTPSTSKNEYWEDGKIPFFSPKDVNGVYCFETEKSITELGLNNCSSHLYPPNTLFITARGTVGKLSLAGVPMAMNQSNYALVAKEGVSNFYLYLIAQTLVSVLLKKANGAVFSAITTRDFNEPTIIPTFSDMERFDMLVSPIFNKIYQTSIESRRLAELRDTLLPKLMSGELKVTDVI